MKTKIYYDNSNNRLVFCNKKATNDFWDKKWLQMLDKKAITSTSYFSRVVRVTKKYLPANSVILEGGCGTGHEVYALSKAGYKAIGIDYTQKTVETIKKLVPELDVCVGDVRNLAFERETFDGYWSIGVIEHFYEGYESIAKEMARVLRPGGYLFLTFPTISPLRKRLIYKKVFPLLKSDAGGKEPDGFYQFALNWKDVKRRFTLLGFNLCKCTLFGAVKGFKDSMLWSKPMLQKFYNSSNSAVRIVRIIADILFSRYCGHCALLVFKKNI